MFAREPSWPEIGSGIREAQLLCERNGGDFRTGDARGACMLPSLGKAVFVAIPDASGEVLRVTVRVADGDSQAWAQRLSRTHGEARVEIVDGARQWTWALATQTVRLVVGDDGLLIDLRSASAE